MFKRLRDYPLFASRQTRSAETPGALQFAFFTPYRTPVSMLGPGVMVGYARAEQGAEAFQPRSMHAEPVGQAFGSPVPRGLVSKLYVLTRGKG